MPKVRWVVSYGFCSTFHTFSSSAKILKIGQDLAMLQPVKRWELFLRQCIHIFGGSCPWWNFAMCKIHFASKPCILLYWQRYCMALQQRTSAKLCGVVQVMELRNFSRGRHLHSAGRPSRWASAHILVIGLWWCYQTIIITT